MQYEHKYLPNERGIAWSWNQRNWNVEQLDMQSSRFCVFASRFDMLSKARACKHCAVQCALAQSNHIICVELIGAWLRSFEFYARIFPKTKQIRSFSKRMIALYKVGRNCNATAFSSHLRPSTAKSLLPSGFSSLTHSSNIIWSLWRALLVLPVWFFLHV